MSIAPDRAYLAMLDADAEWHQRELEQEEADRRRYDDVPLPSPAGTDMVPDAIEPAGSKACLGPVPSPADSAPARTGLDYPCPEPRPIVVALLTDDDPAAAGPLSRPVGESDGAPHA